jgi:hypothetical protein
MSWEREMCSCGGGGVVSGLVGMGVGILMTAR